MSPTTRSVGPSVDNLDTAALALLTHDVALLDDVHLGRPTPCDGWTVTDLLNHMTERHDLTADAVLGPHVRSIGDPRQQFAVSAARWTQAVTSGPTVLPVADLGEPVPTARLRAVHFLDMLVHRWDLTKALGQDCFVDDVITTAALHVARRATAPGSPLVGTAYEPSRSDEGARSAIDRIAALLGRDPSWAARPLCGRPRKVT